MYIYIYIIKDVPVILWTNCITVLLHVYYKCTAFCI